MATTPRQPNRTSFTKDGWTWQGLWFASEKPTQQVVVAIHGFGRPLEEMGNYLPLYGAETAMLSVGIIHQNGSQAPPVPRPPAMLEPDLFQDALQAWLQELGVEGVPAHLLGYSLGGRLAMTLFERHPQAWHGMILLASDGFKKNPMYRFAVETALGRATWGWVDRHAIGVRKVIRGLRRLRILPSHLEHFALHHTESHEMRQLVANTWKTHRKFWPRQAETRAAWATLPERNVHVFALFGTRDAIIPWAWSARWRHLSSSHVLFAQVESGHVMRHPETVDALRRAILGVNNDNTESMA